MRSRWVFLIFPLYFLLVNCSCHFSDHLTRDSEKVSKFDLWSQGTCLRGANIYQRRVYPELDGDEFMGSLPVGPLYTQDDFNRLSAMGANYVNISHPGIFTEDSPYQLDSGILSHLINLVDMIGKADMFVVISFRTGPGRSEFTFFWGDDGDWFDESYYNDQVWLSQDAQSAWMAMWETAASVFVGNPNVVGYDLMVEPNSNDVWLNMWDQEEFYRVYSNTLVDWNQFFPGIVDAIRPVDPETPILVEGMGYAALDWLPFIAGISDTKTVYTFHQYAPFVYCHQTPDGRNCYPGFFDADGNGELNHFNQEWMVKIFQSIDVFKSKQDGPVACNEYGVMRWVCGADRFIGDQMDLFEQNRINYAIWVWEPAWKPWSQEVNAFNFCYGPDPENTSDVDSSELIEVIKQYWMKNTHRPSTTQFNQP